MSVRQAVARFAGPMVVAAGLMVMPTAAVAAEPGQHTVTTGFVTYVTNIDSGSGLVQTYTSPHDLLTLDGTATRIEVLAGPRDYYLIAPVGSRLMAGQSYGVAGSRDEQSPGHAGLELQGPGESFCGPGSGLFTIRELTFASDGTVTGLDVTYEEHCEAGSYAQLGEIHLGLPDSPAPSVVPQHVTWAETEPSLAQTPTPVTITNTGSDPLAVGAPSFTGTAAGSFAVVDDDCPSSLPAAASCRVRLAFRPTTEGTFAAQLVVPTDHGSRSVDLAGRELIGESSMHLDGDYGDWITGGQSFDFARPSSRFDLEIPGDMVYVHVVAPDTADWWAWFGPVQGQTLEVGTYDNAQRSPSPTAPGLDVYGRGHGCGSVTGSFTITQLQRVDGHIVRFAASFVEHCGGVPALRGTVHFRASSASPPVTDTSPPTVTLTSKPAPFSTARSGTVAFTATDPDDASSDLQPTCTLDGTAAPCTNPFTASNLTDGAHTVTVQVKDAAGNLSNIVTASWTVDTVAPSAAMHPLPVFGMGSTIGLSWSGTDVRSGVAAYDVRYQKAPYTGGFAAWVYPATWQGTSAVRATLAGVTAGDDYCFAVRSRDKAGNLSAWTAARCQARPVDDRAFTASAGWTRAAGSAYYGSTYTETTRSGATLTRSGTLIDRVALVATTCANCGQVAVYLNGTLLRTVSLYSATTHRQVLFALPTFTLRRATIVLKVLSNHKTVQVDGIGLSRT